MLIKRGFTLIEVLFVIGLIIFLIQLCMPRYRSSLARARQAEVGLYLSALYTAEQSHYLHHGAYTPVLSALDWKPPRAPYYTYGCTPEHALVGSGGAPASSLSEGSCEKESFKILATAPQSAGNEGDYDIWSIDEGGALVHESSAPEKE